MPTLALSLELYTRTSRTPNRKPSHGVSAAIVKTFSEAETRCLCPTQFPTIASFSSSPVYVCFHHAYVCVCVSYQRADTFSPRVRIVLRCLPRGLSPTHCIIPPLSKEGEGWKRDAKIGRVTCGMEG